MEATAGGKLDIQDAQIANSGIGTLGIKVDGASTFEVDTTELQLTGAGTVALTSGSKVIGNATGDTLENVSNTISGAGTIGTGDGKLTLQNDALGIVDATGGTLEINATVTGVGTLEVGSVIGDTLKLDSVSSATSLTFLGSAGTLELNTNGTLTLTGALAIGTNTLKLDGGSSTLTDAAGITLAGGTISGLGDLAANTNLTGFGTVSIPLNSADTVTANAGTLEFTQAVDSSAKTFFDIAAAVNSILEFDAAVGTISVRPTITFEGGDSGPGTLELVSLSNFYGIVAGFDEGEKIIVPTATSALLANATTLDVYNIGGTLLGVIDFATSYAGATFNVSSEGVITLVEGPVLGGSTSATVSEGGTVTLGVTEAKFDSDDTLGTVTITGLPSDLTSFSGGSYTVSGGVGSWTGTAAQFTALTFHAGEAGTFTLSISATNTEAAGVSTENFTLQINPAPEAPVLGGATSATVTIGGLVTLGVTEAKFDADDTLGNVTVTGLPGDLSDFNGGSYTVSGGVGTWTGTAAQFTALTFGAGSTTGTFTLTISAPNTTPGEAATATEPYTLHITSGEGSELPILGGATSATADRGGLVTLGVTETTFDNDETLGNVTITGLPHDLTNFNAGSYISGTGIWTGTAAQFTALTFDAGNTTGTFTLSISAPSTENGNTATATVPYTLTINSGLAAPSTPDLTTASDSGTSNSDNITNDNTPTFTGTALAGSTVTIYDGATAVGSGFATTSGTYSIATSALSDGTHTITAKDTAGITSPASGSLSVTIDTIAPNAPTNPHFQSGHTVAWTAATDNSGGSGIDHYLYQVDLGSLSTPILVATLRRPARRGLGLILAAVSTGRYLSNRSTWPEM